MFWLPVRTEADILSVNVDDVVKLAWKRLLSHAATCEGDVIVTGIFCPITDPLTRNPKAKIIHWNRCLNFKRIKLRWLILLLNKTGDCFFLSKRFYVNIKIISNYYFDVCLPFLASNSSRLSYNVLPVYAGRAFQS